MRVVVPPVTWSDALRDFADPLQRVLNEVDASAEGDVWFAAHFQQVEPPPHAIIFQTEVRGSGWFTPEYRRRLARARAVWDYSTANRGAYDCQEWHHVPLRFHESMVWPGWRRNPNPDIPVGFFGTMNKRRSAYVRAATLMPVRFGIKRAEWLSRVGAVVVAHFYDATSPVEQARIGMLLANAIPVVAEHSEDEADFPGPVYADAKDLVTLALAMKPSDGEAQRAAYRAKGTAHDAVRAAIGKALPCRT